MSPSRLLVLKSLLPLFFFVVVVLVSSVSCKVALENPGFESPPSNLTANATSHSVLLDAKTNPIPGWSFNGTVWYVTAGQNVSLPSGNGGHALQLGPDGMINQTFKYDGSYDYVLTFTIAPSSTDCATSVNVSGPGVSDVFFFQQSLGSQMWQTYAYSLGARENQHGLMSLQIQSAPADNVTCWPIVDDLIVNGIEIPRTYEADGLVNSGFEVGPSFLEKSSGGVFLVADSYSHPLYPVQSPLQDWTVSGVVRYIDSKHYAVPEGRAAVELVSGDPSGVTADVHFLRRGQVTLEFVMGDANDSCVGSFTVSVQAGSRVWNFTMRSAGEGRSERHSVTFKAEFSSTDAVPISFYSFNQTRSSDGRFLCGPVIDATRLRFSSSLRLEGFAMLSSVLDLAITLLLIL